MSGYGWAQQSFDFAGSGSIITLPNLPVAIPAGCTVKRFQTRNTYCCGHVTGTQSNALNAYAWQPTVKFTAGPYSGRSIYHTTRAMLMHPVAVNTAGSLTNYYDAYYSGGDNEFGINERCSYGKATSTAQTLELDSYLFMEGPPGGVVVSIAVRFIVTLAVLYYQH